MRRFAGAADTPRTTEQQRMARLISMSSAGTVFTRAELVDIFKRCQNLPYGLWLRDRILEAAKEVLRREYGLCLVFSGQVGCYRLAHTTTRGK